MYICWAPFAKSHIMHNETLIMHNETIRRPSRSTQGTVFRSPPVFALRLCCPRDVACFTLRHADLSSVCFARFHAIRAHHRPATRRKHATRRNNATRRGRATRRTRNTQRAKRRVTKFEFRITKFEFRARKCVGARRKLLPWSDSGWLAGWLAG